MAARSAVTTRLMFFVAAVLVFYCSVAAAHPGTAVSVPNRDESARTEEMRKAFPGISRTQMQRHLKQVEEELAMTAATIDSSDTQARSTASSEAPKLSVLKKLESEESLTRQQVIEIKELLAEVRQHFTSLCWQGRVLPDQEVNWIHTQGELGHVLSAARVHSLRGKGLEDSLIASMFSDSCKFTDSPITKENFTTHHLDGALAAGTVLSRRAFDKQRIQRIVEAILQHQVAPPRFMAMIYYKVINRNLNQAKNEARSEDEKRRCNELQATLESMTEKGTDGVPRITKIAEPLQHKCIDTYPCQLVFSPDEQDVLKFAGINSWFIPGSLENVARRTDVGQRNERRIEASKIAQCVVEGDAIDNYATAGGASKIVKIRGPETMFRDATIWDSIDSIDTSLHDAETVMTREGVALAEQEVTKRRQVVAALKDEIHKWISQQVDIPFVVDPSEPSKKKIAFVDVALHYPDELTPAEKSQLLQPKLLDDRTANKLRYKGLTPEQIKQFEFAERIRDFAVDRLRAAQRIDGKPPGRFAPIVSTSM